MVALAYMEGLRVVKEPPVEYVAGATTPTFSALPHAVLFDTALTPGARLTYAVLQAHWWQGGECWAAHATLARQIGCKERMLRYYLRELIEAGYISERRRGHGQAKAYAPIQAAIDCQLNRQEDAGSEPKRQPVASQAATHYQFKRQPVANRRRRTEEDSPKEEDTGVSVAADAAPPHDEAKALKKTRATTTLAPDEFLLTDRHLAYAAGLGFDAQQAQRLTDAFLSHHRFKGTRGVDWYAGWQNWLRREVTYAKQRPGSAPSKPAPNGTGSARRPISQSAKDLLANDPEWGVKR